MEFLKFSVVILFLILTIFTIKIHPEMHQPMIIEDADFKLNRISDSLVSQNIKANPKKNSEQEKNIIIQEQTPTKTNIEIALEEQKTKEIPTKIDTKQPQAEPSQLELLQEILKNLKEEENSELTEEKPSIHKNPYMTEKEEIIAWNIWRSNILNEVLQTSDAGQAPFGTLFIFSFLVDKYGNVSNIKVMCSNAYCADVANNSVKPAIENLQRKPILNFPKGTQRTSVVVTGSVLVSFEDRASTPGDFSDYERVVH